MTAAQDPVTILAAIRERRANSDFDGLWRPTVADLDLFGDDIPRLLKAVEAALKLADKWEAEARGIFLEAARTAEAGEVGVASALQSAAADLREAIRASLTGQEAGDER